jgi:hypothetical protein
MIGAAAALVAVLAITVSYWAGRRHMGASRLVTVTAVLIFAGLGIAAYQASALSEARGLCRSTVKYRKAELWVSPDGTVVTAGKASAYRVWSVETGKTHNSEAACRTANRALGYDAAETTTWIAAPWVAWVLAVASAVVLVARPARRLRLAV